MRMMDTWVSIRIKYFNGGVTIYISRGDKSTDSWDSSDEDSEDIYFRLNEPFLWANLRMDIQKADSVP